MDFLTKQKKRLQWALKSKKEKQALLDSVFELIGYSGEAQKLLDLARADGVEICFDTSLTGSRVGGFFSPSASKIKMCPFTPEGEISTAIIMAPHLVHELRHYWQYKNLGLTPENFYHPERNLRTAFLLSRVFEADAFAFQHAFIGNINEIYSKIKEADKKILEAQEKGLSPDERDVLDKELKKLRPSRQTDATYLAEEFIKIVKDKRISDAYDPKKAIYLYEAQISGFDEVKNVPELTISDIKKVLKAGTAENAPGYLDNLTDREFERLILGHAHREAFHAVRLMEKFKLAAADNDNEKAKILHTQVRKKIQELAI